MDELRIVVEGAIISGAVLFFVWLKGIFTKTRNDLKEKQRLEALAKTVVLEAKIVTTDAVAIAVAPVVDQMAGVKSDLATFIALSSVQKQLLENQGGDIDELKRGKASTETLLEKAVSELEVANQTISILAIGYQNLNRNFRDAGIKYDGSADTILEASKRTIAQTGENVPSSVKEQMK